MGVNTAPRRAARTSIIPYIKYQIIDVNNPINKNITIAPRIDFALYPLASTYKAITIPPTAAIPDAIPAIIPVAYKVGFDDKIPGVNLNNCNKDINRIKIRAIILEVSTGRITVANKPIGIPKIDPIDRIQTTGILASRIPPLSITIPATASRNKTIGINCIVGNIPTMLATTIADKANPENPLKIPAKKNYKTTIYKFNLSKLNNF